MISNVRKVKANYIQFNWHSLIRGANLFTAVIAISYTLEFFVLAVIRMLYPFELEWIEGAHLDEIRWIMTGHFPYGPPSISFLPSSYTPLYFYLSALAMKFLGVGFVAPRLISIVSTLGTLLLIFTLVKKEAHSPIPAIIAVGIYTASFRFAGAWMDLTKTDSLFLFLIIFGFWIGQRYSKWWGMVASGIIFVLAYFTKQMSLPIVLVMAPISLASSKGRTWLQWLTVAILGPVVFEALDSISKGWFSFYTFDAIALHKRTMDFMIFWRAFLPKMWPALLMALLFLIFVLKDTHVKQWKWPERFWQLLGLATALLLGSWSITLKVWTYDNSYLLACLGIAIIAGLGFGELMKLDLLMIRQFDFLPFFISGAIILFGVQFLLLYYDPIAQIPTQEDRQAGNNLVALVRDLPGDVLVFNHGYVNYLAGKNSYLQISALLDVIGGNEPKHNSDTYWRREQVWQTFNQARSKQIFDWAITDEPNQSWAPYYIYTRSIFHQPSVFFPVTGGLFRPESLMVKNPVARGGELNPSNSSLDPFFESGWGSAQDWGRWANAGRATVNVWLEEKHDYKIVVSAHPNCLQGKPFIQTVEMYWDDQLLGEQMISACNTINWSQVVRANQVSNAGNHLGFVFKSSTNTDLSNPQGSQPTHEIGISSLAFIQK